jgi:hypothetical protein
MVPANRDVEQALVHLIRRRKVYRKFGTLERPDGVEEEEAPHRPKPRRRKRRRPGKAADHENPHNSPEREAPRGLTEND